MIKNDDLKLNSLKKSLEIAELFFENKLVRSEYGIESLNISIWIDVNTGKLYRKTESSPFQTFFKNYPTVFIVDSISLNCGSSIPDINWRTESKRFMEQKDYIQIKKFAVDSIYDALYSKGKDSDNLLCLVNYLEIKNNGIEFELKDKTNNTIPIEASFEGYKTKDLSFFSNIKPEYLNSQVLLGKLYLRDKKITMHPMSIVTDEDIIMMSTI